MKFLLATIGIMIAGVLGYVLEPSLRFSLTGQKPAIKATAKAEPLPDATETPVPVTKPAAPSFDYSNLQPEQLPERIVLKSQTIATVLGETDTLPLPAGNKVKPTRIDGDFVHFSVAGTAQGKVAIDQTDLVEQLIANPPAPVSAPPPVVPPVDPTPAPAPEPLPEKEPEVVTQPQPQPMPAPEPAPAPVASSLSPDQIVTLMQNSIRSGQIKEFTFNQVQSWKGAESEEVNGETFQTGLVAYKAETIFGVKSIQAKAMIQNGKVVRWIWPTSGLEIE